MNITNQPNSNLTTIIKIELQPEDYQGRVNDVIRQYQKSANIPGFRPGKVPAGIIKKMYGKAVLVEELNKLLSESLSKYIAENKIEAIGTPLPIRNETEQSFEDGKQFDFSYELGLAPSFNPAIPVSPIPVYKIQVDEKMVDDDINDLRRRYGKFTNPDVSEEQHILYGEFNELDADGNIKEGGVKNTTTLSIEMIPDVQMRKPFIGLSKSGIINFNPLQTYVSETEVLNMLGVEKNSPAIKADYRFTVMSVNQIDKAELNQELFDKILGEGKATTESEFRDKIRERIGTYFEKDSDSRLKKDFRKIFLEESSIPLPDDFLKRMLKANEEKPKEDHDFEHEYFHLSEDLRWNLIAERFAQEQNIVVTEEDVQGLSRQMVRHQFSQYGYYDLEETKVEELSKRYLSEDQNYDKMDRMIRENKVFEYLKTAATLEPVYLPYEEFVKKMTEKTQHEVEHHH